MKANRHEFSAAPRSILVFRGTITTLDGTTEGEIIALVVVLVLGFFVMVKAEPEDEHEYDDDFRGFSRDIVAKIPFTLGKDF